MSYQHSYSSYVNHVLNKSPSKTTYSFAKAQRFPSMVSNQIMNAQHQQYPVGQVYCQKMLREERKSIEKQKRDIYRTQNSPQSQFERIIMQLQRRKSKSPSRHQRRNSPQIQYRKNMHYGRSPTKNIYKSRSKSPSPSKYRQTPFNKYYRQKNKSPERQQPPKSRQYSPSRNYTYYEEMKQMNHPAMNATITGYYPVGTEISPTGRYASSRIPNIVGTRFSPPSPKRKKLQESQTTVLGPGAYPVFSQFGP